jgi:hypothetical protein
MVSALWVYTVTAAVHSWFDPYLSCMSFTPPFITVEPSLRTHLLLLSVVPLGSGPFFNAWKALTYANMDSKARVFIVRPALFLS